MVMTVTVPPDLDALVNIEQVIIEKKSLPDLRQQILADAACAVGVRGGFLSRSKQLKKEIEERSSTLDKFSFASLTLKDSLYPPVISEVDGSTYQDGTSMVRISGKIYRIERAERFTLAPLTWRDYVYVGVPTDDATVPMPNKELLPKNDEEKEFWKQEVKTCWEQGVQQAEHLFSVNLAKMERDFYGMLLYRKLLSKSLVDAPNVEYLYKKVIGEGSEMSIDNHAYTVTKPGYLKHPEQREKDKFLEKQQKIKKRKGNNDNKWRVNALIPESQKISNQQQNSQNNPNNNQNNNTNKK